MTTNQREEDTMDKKIEQKVARVEKIREEAKALGIIEGTPTSKKLEGTEP